MQKIIIMPIKIITNKTLQKKSNLYELIPLIEISIKVLWQVNEHDIL
jgi:hypothetical protein